MHPIVEFMKESGLWWYTFTGHANYEWWRAVRDILGGDFHVSIDFFAKTDEEATAYVNQVIIPFYERQSYLYKSVSFVEKGLHKSGWQDEKLINCAEVVL